MTFANGRLQLMCSGIDVTTLSERELCLAVFMLQSKTLLLGSQLNEKDQRDDAMNFVVLMKSQTLTDAGRDLLRQIITDHLERLRRQQAGDRQSEARTQRKSHSPSIKARPDLGVTHASIAELPHTNE